uniref:HTH myb-type domain-containing protein n=1 Tax=Chaetoceros debilis TaxID=122233 RepID=A0A7S3QDX4_9STRA
MRYGNDDIAASGQNNPMASANKPKLGTSVVPDLMRVYESLTQSKTPQQPPIPGPGPGNNYMNLNVSSESQQYQQHPTSISKPAKDDSADYCQVHQQIALGPAFQPTANNRLNVQINVNSTAHATTIATCKRALAPQKDATEHESKRKKRGGSDGRWSRRFAWPDELHRDFVSAVFDVGLKHSSPSALLEQMPKHEDITSERIKSHLQKYRLHRQKSKKEFMSSYDRTLMKMKRGEIESNSSSLNSGEVAAHLSFTSIQKAELGFATANSDENGLLQGGILQLPQLTEDEKQSHVGTSLGYLMGLFFSLKQQLLAKRAEANQRSGNNLYVHHHNILEDPIEGQPAVPAPIPSDTNDATDIQPSSDAITNISHKPTYSQNQQLPRPTSTLANPSLHHLQQQQQQQHGSVQPSQQQPNDTSSTPAESRTNNPIMEESKMMKREMKSQMAFQNKMRKLKEQELNKYTLQTTSFTNIAQLGSDIVNKTTPQSEDGCLKINSTSAVSEHVPVKEPEAVEVNETDFWTSGEILDDQLFEFLMND